MSHGKVEYDKENPQSNTLVWVLLLSGLFLVLLFFSSFYFYRTIRTMELNKKENVGTYIELERYRTSELEIINSGEVTINKAIKSVVQDYNR